MIDYKYAIDFLNELVKLDRKAIEKLIENRVECNKELGDHPTVQTGFGNATTSTYCVGMLGILNGLFGSNQAGWGYIAAVFDDDGNLIGFQETKLNG